MNQSAVISDVHVNNVALNNIACQPRSDTDSRNPDRNISESTHGWA